MKDCEMHFSVGQIAPSSLWSRWLTGQEGSNIELLKDGTGCITIFAPRISNREASRIKHSPMEIRVRQEGSHILTLVALRKSGLILELSLDPTLYPEEERPLRLAALEPGRIFRLLAIDSFGGIVRSVREFRLPESYLELLKGYAASTLAIPGFSLRQLAWEQTITRNHTTDQLFQEGKIMGLVPEK